MTAPRFPRSPQITPRPFEDGQNPFADDITTPIPLSDNPLQPSIVDEVQPYKPVDYVQTLPDRSYRVMIYGIIGCSLIAVSLLIAAIIVATSLWSSELVYCWPADLLGLAFTIPAWMMGKADRRAIQAGAMDPGGSFRNRVGYLCGSLGTLVGVVPFALVVVYIVSSIIG